MNLQTLDNWQTLAEAATEESVHTADFDSICDAFPVMLAELRSERELRKALEKALLDLYAEVETAESVGVCLRDRTPSLNAAALLGREPEHELLGRSQIVYPNREQT